MRFNYFTGALKLTNFRFSVIVRIWMVGIINETSEKFLIVSHTISKTLKFKKIFMKQGIIGS